MPWRRPAFDPRLQPRAGRFELLVGAGIVLPQLGERRAAGGDGERVSRQRPRLVDRASGGDPPHQVARAGVGGERQAAADHLAEGGQVGGHAEQRLRASPADPEAGHHLVEDQQRAVAVAEIAQPGEETGDGRDQVHVAGDRLDDHGGDLIPRTREERLDRREVVVRREQGVGHHGGRHAGGGGDADRRRAGAGGDQEGVGMAVVAPCEFDEAVAPGGGAGEAQGRHGRFGPRVDQADHVDRRQRGGDRLRDLHLGAGRRADRRAAAERLGDRRHHRRMAMPQDVRTVAADVVDVAPAVLALEPGPLRRAHEDRRAADAAEGADGGVDAAGEDLLGPLHQSHGWFLRNEHGKSERRGGACPRPATLRAGASPAPT